MLRQCNAHTDSFGETGTSSIGRARKKTSPGNRMVYYGSDQDGFLEEKLDVAYVGGVG